MGKLKALTLAMAVVPMFSFAADDAWHDIKFTGEITGETCSVTVNGDEGGEVKMPTVAATSLATAGSSAGDTDFTIKISPNCIGVSGAGDVPVNTLIKAAGAVTAAGNLDNQGTAEFVEVQLKDPQGNHINLSSGSVLVDGMILAADGSGGEMTLNASYYTQTGTVTPGTVVAPAMFAFSMP